MVSCHEVQRISDFAEVKTGPFGSALHQKDYKATGTPIVTVEHLGDRGIIHQNLPLVGTEDLKRLSTYKCREGDILFSRVGSIDRNAIVKGEEDGWLFSGRLLRVRVDQAKVNSGYLSQVFHTENFKDKVRSVAVGQTMPSLNTQILGSLTVDLPSLDEQKIVAGRLSSADQLIETLERLISKKQAIKQGMMQELLTGRKRLPGFTKPWKNISIARHSHLKARIGWHGLTTGEYLQSGSYKLVGGTDFKNAKIDWNSAAFVSKWRFDQDRNIQLQSDDVLITKDGTIGKVAIVDNLPFPATLNSGVFVVRPIRGTYESRFLYWLLRSSVFENFISSLSAGSTINHLYQKDLNTLTLDFPEDFSEQREIASVLDDADSEIRALESRLESARNIKQGMMQELLTGRIRLPVGGKQDEY